MKVVIIGAGKVGRTLGERLQALGYSVGYVVRNASTERRRELGAPVIAAADAAGQADLLLLATPWATTRAAVEALGDCGGRILIDATNPLNAEKNSLLFDGEKSGAEQIQEWVKNARVVKAFNSVGFPVMANPEIDGQRSVMYVCSDHADARSRVVELSDQLGFDSLAFGELQRSRLIEHWALTWITLAYHHDMGFNFRFVVQQPQH